MKRFIAHILITTLVFGGVLASPAVMAWSMPVAGQSAANQPTACALCQADPASQSQGAATTTACAVAACAMAVGINEAATTLIRPPRTAPVFDLRIHSGRLLPGPDPFPPRYSHA